MADVLIGLAGRYTATVERAKAYTLDAMNVAAAGATVDVRGTLNFDGGKVLSVSAGTLLLNSGGTIKGASVSNAGGSIGFAGGTLDGVTYRGTLDLSAQNSSVAVTNGITLTGTSGNGAGAVIIGDLINGAYGELAAYGTTTLDDATITVSFGVLSHLEGSRTDGVLTLGSGLTLQDGGRGYLFDGSSSGDGIVNKGKILASVNGGVFEIYGNGLTNEGTIAVSNGDHLLVETTTFRNNGTVTVSAASAILHAGWSNTGKIIVSNGGTLQLGTDITTPWDDVGLISATASTVNLYGQFTTAKLKALVLSNDVIAVAGQLVNAGTTLTSGNGSLTGMLNLTGGTITGGVVLAGSLVFNGGTLDRVTYRGTLDLSADGAAASITNGIILTGAAGTGAGAVVIGNDIARTYGVLTVYGSTTLDDMTINLSYGALLHYGSTGTNDVLTLGSGVILQDSGQATLSEYASSNGTIVNKGKILASSGSGDFSVVGNSFGNQGTINVSKGDSLIVATPTFSNSGTLSVSAALAILDTGWSNTGKIVVSNGGTLQLGSDLTTSWRSVGSISATASTVNLYGQFTTAQLNAMMLSNDVVNIVGHLINTGTNLMLGGGSSLGTLNLTYRGTITGGVVSANSKGQVFTGGTLDAVTYRGTLDLSVLNASVAITHGIVVTGTAGTGVGAVTIGNFATRSYGNLSVFGKTTLDNMTISLSYGLLSGYEDNDGDNALTLGSGVTVQGGLSASLGGGSLSGGATINKGVITASARTGQFYIYGKSFINQGTINVSNGHNLTVATTTFSNSGTLTISAGSMTLGAGWSNTGKIIVDAGLLQLGTDTRTPWGDVGSITATRSTVNLFGQFTTAKLKTLVLSNSALNVAGDLLNTGTTLEPGGGNLPRTLNLAGGTITGGVVLAGSVVFNGGTLDQVNYRGTLDLGAKSGIMMITNGISLTGSAGTGAGAVVIGSDVAGTYSTLAVNGTTTLDNMTINLKFGMLTSYGGGDLGLTLGRGVTVQDGGSATLNNPFSGSIVSKGKIFASTNAGRFYVIGSGFSNQGTIAVSNGDTLDVATTTFSNSGTLTVSAASAILEAGWSNSGKIVVSNGGTLQLGNDFTTPWDRVGSISATASTVNLYGQFTTAKLNALVLSNCASNIVGHLINTGTTLVLGNGSSLGTLNLTGDGVITGGVISPGNNGLVFTGGRLDAVTYRGTLDLTAPNASLSIYNGINFAGPTGSGAGTVSIGNDVAGNRNYLYVADTTTLDNVAIYISNGGLQQTGSSAAGDVLTLGRGLTLLGGRYAYLSTGGLLGDSIINNGKILANTTGGFFLISGDTFTNQGAIVSSDKDLLAIGVTNFTNLMSGTLSGGSYTVGGGSTIDITSRTPVAVLAATLVLAGTGSIFEVSAPTGPPTIEIESSLTRVAVGGVLSLLSGRIFDASNALTVDGVLNLRSGTYGSVKALTVSASGTLTGAGTVTSAVYSTGLISAVGGTLTLSGAVSGYGALAAHAGAVLQATQASITALSGKITLDGAGSGIRFVNGGVTTDLSAGLTSIASNGSLLILGGRGYAAKGALADQGFLNLQGGALSAGKLSVTQGAKLLGYGAVTSSLSNNGTIEAYGGVLKLALVQGSGILQIDAASTLELGAAASCAVSFASGAAGTLQLDAASSFSGAIGGLALGDAIKFSNETITSAIVSGSTLTVASSAGTMKYQVLGALPGTHFAIQSDQHTIKLIAGAMREAQAEVLPTVTSAGAWTPSLATQAGLSPYEPAHPLMQLVQT